MILLNGTMISTGFIVGGPHRIRGSAIKQGLTTTTESYEGLIEASQGASGGYGTPGRDSRWIARFEILA
jgi:hypothetical protein